MPEHRWVLVRHAPAMPRDPARWPGDRDRPIRPSGKIEFEEAAAGLAPLLGNKGTLVTSPLTRARETSAIVSRWWKNGGNPRIWPELEPEVAPSALFDRARAFRGSGDLVLVGHEPLLSSFAGYCIMGEGLSVLKLSKGGAVALEFPGKVRPGAARILWALTRNQLREMR